MCWLLLPAAAFFPDLSLDTELAIALSMKNGSPVDSTQLILTPPTLSYQSLSQNNNSDDTAWAAVPSFTQPHPLIQPHPLTLPRPPTMPHPSGAILPYPGRSSQTLPSAKHTTNGDLLSWRRALIEGWDERPSSSSSEEEEELAAAAGYGPVFGEEEDLARAIQLSLAESPAAAPGMVSTVAIVSSSCISPLVQ